LTLNECGISIQNNSSFIIDNKIEKQHQNGIEMIGNDNSTRCCPIVWRNHINICGFNGILCSGKQCEPDIRGNILQRNRKAGIKLTDLAIAQIGGTAKVDIKFIPATVQTQ
jgi:hypothetical protein